MLLWGLFLCLPSPFIIVQLLSDYTLSPNKPVPLQRAELRSQAEAAAHTFSLAWHLSAAAPAGMAVRVPFAGSGNPWAQTGHGLRQARGQREAHGAKRFWGVLAVHISSRNQPGEAWKARPFYSPELRLWLAAGARPKLHLKCFRQPICARFGSRRSACRGPLLTGARRKQGGKKGARSRAGRRAPRPSHSQGERTHLHTHSSTGEPSRPPCLPAGLAQGRPGHGRLGLGQRPRLGRSLASAPPAAAMAVGPCPPLSLPEPPWSLMSPHTSW